MTTLRFELTMPNNGAWNGVDTGSKGNHFLFRKVPKNVADNLEGKSFYYDFGDGWGANILVTKNRTSKSNGFRGYGWMVDEIIKYGEIKNVHERRLKNKVTKEFRVMLSKIFSERGLIECDSNFVCSELSEAFNFELNQAIYEKEKEQSVRGLTQ